MDLKLKIAHLVFWIFRAIHRGRVESGEILAQPPRVKWNSPKGKILELSKHSVDNSFSSLLSK